MVSLAHGAVGVSLAASSLLGIGVRSGRIDLGSRRWLHHVLYAASLATAASATAADVRRRRPTWPVAAATLGVLVVLPATRGGSTGHLAVAFAASTVYVGGTLAMAR